MNNLKTLLAEYYQRHIEFIDEWFSWDFNDNDLPNGINIEPQNVSSFQRNIQLKEALSQAWLEGNLERKFELVDYYVRVWGGIRANNNNTMLLYANGNVEQFIEQKGIARVASWSKALCVQDFNTFPIFDSRVSAALNSLQYLSNEQFPILWPRLTPRGQHAIAAGDFFNNHSAEYHWLSIPNASVYHVYMKLLNSVAQELNTSVANLEMLLFGKSHELIENALGL